MDINQINLIIRKVVNDDNASRWFNAKDRKSFSHSLLGPIKEHEVVISILVDVIDELLQRKAEDMYANYHIGDGVTILESGHCIPATVIEHPNDSKLIVQLDTICSDGHFEKDLSGKTIDFHCSHDRVYVHLEGRSLSRLVSGRKFVDYSPEHLKEEIERLTG